MTTDTEAAFESRLAELEVKLSFSEDMLEALNQTIYRQQQQLDQLQKALQAVRDQVRASLPDESRNPLDETPPHY